MAEHVMGGGGEGMVLDHLQSIVSKTLFTQDTGRVTQSSGGSYFHLKFLSQPKP